MRSGSEIAWRASNAAEKRVAHGQFVGKCNLFLRPEVVIRPGIEK